MNNNIDLLEYCSHHNDDGGSGGTNHGVNPLQFGPSTWLLLFSLAKLLDDYFISNTSENNLHLKAKELFFQFSDMLPCLECRTSSAIFLKNPDIKFIYIDNYAHSSYVDFVYWLRIMVNRKLFKQKLMKSNKHQYEQDNIRQEWRNYHTIRQEIKLIPISSSYGLKSILTCLWWMCKSNRVRPNVILFTNRLSSLLYDLNEFGLAKFLKYLWQCDMNTNINKLPNFGKDLGTHLDKKLMKLQFTPKQLKWLCIWKRYHYY